MKTMMKKLLLLLVFLPCSIFAQATLSGVVSDATGPLPGVNVKVLGTSNGAATDFNGAYALKNLKKGDKIEFSFIGYKEMVVSFNGQKTQNVTLVEDSKVLEEVVVQVGYGSVKKKDATGAVTTISAKDFNKGPAVSADQLLVGKAPGVRITSEGGQPDANPNIRIRGGSSLNGNNNPLIIIDGIPIDNVNPAGISNPLSLVNSNDIESFTVLKDASATAIYGSRASNGVIIITTKKGTSGAPKFTFSTTTSLGVVGKRIDVMDGNEFVSFIETNYPALTNLLGVSSGEIDPSTGKEKLDDLSTRGIIEGRTIYNTDWQDLIYRNSISTDNSFSARANLFGKIPFRASLGQIKNEGVVKTNDLERYTGSIKLTPAFFDNHLKVDINAKGIMSNKNAINDGGALGAAVSMDPTRPAFDYSGTGLFGEYYQSLQSDSSKLGGTNPLATLYQRSRPQKTSKVLANVEFDYKLHMFKDLRAVVNLGIEASKSKIEESFSQNSIDTYTLNTINKTFVFNPGYSYFENQTQTNKTLDSYLAYNKILKGFITRVDAQAGYSFQNFVTDGTKIEYQSNPLGQREIIFNEQNPTNRYYNPLNLQSFFGRTNFDLVDRYLFTFTLRADASSLFKPENRWGYFPAAGFAWRIKDEGFLKDSKTFSDLKLRLGWGQTGQQDITQSGGGYFPYTALFIPGKASSAYFPGLPIYSANGFNENLKWETTTTYNAGVDFELFKNNLFSGSVDVYKRLTTNLLSQTDLPVGQSIVDAFVGNVGSMVNKGIEVNLNVKPISTESFSVSVNGNISYNIGEITDLGGKKTVQDPNSGLPVSTGQRLAYNTIGEQPFSAYVFEQIYDSNLKPIQGAFADRNNDGVITDDDKYHVAIRPNWTYGFGFNVAYKQFDISSGFRGQLGGKVYNSRKLQSGFSDAAKPGVQNILTNVLDGEHDFVNVRDKQQVSDYYLEDATFLRCQNITLGYKIDEIVKGVNVKFFISGTNLFILTKYSGQDPENFNGQDNNLYPRPKVYSFGLNLDF